MTQATIVTSNDPPRITPTAGTPRRFTRPYCGYRGEMIDAVAAAISRDARQRADSPNFPDSFTGVKSDVDEDRDTLQQFGVSLSDYYPFFRTGGMFESRAGVRSLKRSRVRQLERELARRRAAFEARVERVEGESGDGDEVDTSETSDDSDDSPAFKSVTVTPVGGDEDDAWQSMIRSRDTDVPVGDVEESVDGEPVEGDPAYDHCPPGEYNIETCRCCGCPDCGNRSIYYRQSLSPDYRCRTQTCKHEFDHPAELSRRGD